MKIKELPELERPYEKLEMYGEKVLSDAELLAIIIKTGTKEETAVQLAQRLLSLNNTEEENLKFLQTLTIQELMEQKGIGKVKAIQLKAVGEIAIRMFRTSNYNKKIIKKPQDLAKILMSDLYYQKEEIVKIVILNTKNEILKIEEQIKDGTLKIKEKKKSLQKVIGSGNKGKNYSGKKNRPHGFLKTKGKTWFRRPVKKSAKNAS